MIIIFTVLILINLLIILRISNLANLINIYDKPDKNLKIHKKDTPILGGLIFFINLIILIFCQLYFFDKFLFLEINAYKIRDIIGILFLILSFFIIGIYDDKYNLAPFKKLFLLSIFIIISLFFNSKLEISNFSVSFYDHKIFLNHFSLIFTIFCFLILTNSLNFYDGINGQSCIFFILIFSYLLIKSDMNEFYLFNIFILVFLLFLNLRNKIFLGDSGIFLVASLISISLIYEYNYIKNIRFADEIFLLLLLPGFDLIRLTLIRIINGKNAFKGDRNHIHHLINDKIPLLYTNLILGMLAILPIISFLYLKLNFESTFAIFVIVYCFLIFVFKSKNKKY